MDAQTASVSCALDPAEKARLFAEHRHCTLEELAAEALRSYIGLGTQQSPEVQEHLERAMEMGLTPDEYAVRLVRKYAPSEELKESANLPLNRYKRAHLGSALGGRHAQLSPLDRIVEPYRAR